MNKADILDALSDREKSHATVEIETIVPTFDGKKRGFLVNGEHALASNDLFTQMSNQMKVPSTFMKSTDQELATKVVEHLGAKLKPTKLLTVDGKPVRVYGKSLPYTRPTELISTVLDKFSSFSEMDLHQSVDFIQVGFHSDTKLLEPRVGDIVKGGVNLRFSDFGIMKPEIEAASYRLTCLNGAIHPEFVHKVEITEKIYSELIARITSSIDSAMNMFDTVIAPKMAKSANTAIDPMQAIRRTARAHGMNAKQLDRVMAAYAIEPMATMWGVANAFTRAAHQFGYNERHRLQSIGGQIVHTADHAHCSTCAAEM